MWLMPFLIAVLSIALGWWGTKFVVTDPSARVEITFAFLVLVLAMARLFWRRWQSRSSIDAAEQARLEWINQGLSAEAAKAVNEDPHDAWDVLRGEAKPDAES